MRQALDKLQFLGIFLKNYGFALKKVAALSRFWPRKSNFGFIGLILMSVGEKNCTRSAPAKKPFSAPP